MTQGSRNKKTPFFGSAWKSHLLGSNVSAVWIADPGCVGREAQAGPRFALARLAKGVKGKPDLTRFVPSFCEFDPPAGELPEVKTVPSQGSGDLASFSRSNCFLVVPEGTDRLKAGATVRILMI